jgi:beta-lactamase regulating signal transducer with metallopeptidase domain
MSFISKIITGELINAIGWTIIHSLWQGIVVALVFGLVMLSMRRCSSRARYYIGVMALMLILAVSVVTFVSIYHPVDSRNIVRTQKDSAPVSITGAGGTMELADPIVKQPNRDFSSTVTAIFKSDLNRFIPLVTTVWILGVLVLALRLTGGCLYNQRLKLHRTKPLSASWQHRLEKLCHRAKIRQPVRILESALVKVPITIGHLKPVILFPVGLVTGLPADQVEALLAHELAHILRKDYLVNILQNFIDILYFYHPGVRWISTRVRSERENCCDDIAVSISGDSLNVAEALTNIQAYNLKIARQAVAFAGKTPRLLERIKRLIHPPQTASQFTENFIAVSILGVFILTLVLNANAAADFNKNITTDPLLISNNNNNTPGHESKSKEEVSRVIKGELIKDKLIENGIYFEIKLTNKGLFINDIPQTAALFKKYKALYENLVGKILEKEISLAIFNMNEEFERQIDESKEMMRLEKRHQKELTKLKEEYKEKDRKLREKLENLDEEMKRDEQRLNKKMAKDAARSKLSLKNRLILKKELQKDGLIRNEKKLKVRLTTYNSGEFYINDTKQPEKVFKKYKYLIEKLYATLEEGSLTITLDW